MTARIGGHDLQYPQFTSNELRSVAAEVRASAGRRGSISELAAEVADALAAGETEQARHLARFGLHTLYARAPEHRGHAICQYLVSAIQTLSAPQGRRDPEPQPQAMPRLL